jgi:hypothetical protein
VNRDNTVCFENLHLQIEPVRWRATLAGCTVTVDQHLIANKVSVSIKNQENEVMVETDTPTKHRARFGVWTQ